MSILNEMSSHELVTKGSRMWFQCSCFNVQLIMNLVGKPLGYPQLHVFLLWGYQMASRRNIVKSGNLCKKCVLLWTRVCLYSALGTMQLVVVACAVVCASIGKVSSGCRTVKRRISELFAFPFAAAPWPWCFSCRLIALTSSCGVSWCVCCLSGPGRSA